MTNPTIEYIGPDQGAVATGPRRWLARVPLAFLLVVGAPTLLAAIYYLLIASPRYVSEARFVVRAQSQEVPSSLGVALQGVGLATTQTDAFAVHEYISSRDGLRDLERRMNVRQALAARGSDFLARHPRPWDGRSEDALYEGFQRFLTVGYDSTNGISTIRVEAFRPEDAQRMTAGLLTGGETLVNRLNERASRQAVLEAERAVEEADQRLAAAQSSLAAFRNQSEFIDPARVALESSQLVGSLSATIAGLRAERDQLAQAAPQSPQLPELSGRIVALERQVAAERARVAGGPGSLVPKITVYEDLMLDRELADRAVSSARIALDNARLDATRQKLYLERVVEPNLPDKASQPRRWLSLLAVFASALLTYGLGYLVWAGVREHRQHG